MCIRDSNYTAGGKKLAVASQLVTLETDTACVDFANVSWQTATITARGALIYNTSSSDKAVPQITTSSIIPCKNPLVPSPLAPIIILLDDEFISPPDSS